MLRTTHILIFIVFVIFKLNAQSVSYVPETILGNRSFAYQHFVGYNFNEKWSINNISLVDADHTNYVNNIFFVRNRLFYNLNKRFNINIAFGVKNPGSFTTLATQYKYSTINFTLGYTIGATYQDGFTLEHTLQLKYTPKLGNKTNIYLNLFMIMNTDLQNIDRGIQQFRLGLKKEKIISGMAINLDQFANAEKKLTNIGIFIKYNF